MRPCTSRCTYKHAGWKEACDYDKPRCLPRALPGFGRGWGGMLKKPGEAKHTVPKWRWGGGGEMEAWSEGEGGLDALPYAHPPSLQRPHVCQPSTGASLLPILPILVSLPAVSLSLFLSRFFYCPDFQVFLLLCGFNYKLLLCLGTNKDLQTKHKFPSKWEHVVDFDDHPLHPV